MAKVLNQAGLFRVLMVVLDKADGLVVSGEDLASLDDKVVVQRYDSELDVFELKLVDKPEEKLIQVARSRYDRRRKSR